MKQSVSKIPFYKNIGEFIKTIIPTLNFDETKNRDLFCLRSKKGEGKEFRHKSPFKIDFYSIVLITDAGNSKIIYDNTEATNLDSFLVLQSPGLLYGYDTDIIANGHIIFFKPELFSFFKPDFEKEFNFFDAVQTNFYKLSKDEYLALAPHFEFVFQAYKNKDEIHQKIASLRLLSLLYELKKYTGLVTHDINSSLTPQQIMFKKYLNLINRYYLEKRTVEEYASLLSVSPNYFSQTIKSISKKNALYFINDKIIKEAKSLILHTNCTISEIAYQLSFADTSYFSKFFKKHTGLTPLEYKKAHIL